MKITKINDILEVELLLNGCSLPTADLKINHTVQFFGVYQNKNLIACIGVEIYGDAALLRSLAVDSKSRKKGIARQLSEYVENYCNQNSVREVFLLTETAEKYFENHGYKIQNRDDAPLHIKSTTQFSDLCPSSSIFMKKTLNG
jgi:amino-acid N-acetyltransferase